MTRAKWWKPFGLAGISLGALTAECSGEPKQTCIVDHAPQARVEVVFREQTVHFDVRHLETGSGGDAGSSPLGRLSYYAPQANGGDPVVVIVSTEATSIEVASRARASVEQVCELDGARVFLTRWPLGAKVDKTSLLAEGQELAAITDLAVLGIDAP